MKIEIEGPKFKEVKSEDGKFLGKIKLRHFRHKIHGVFTVYPRCKQRYLVLNGKLIGVTQIKAITQVEINETENSKVQIIVKGREMGAGVRTINLITTPLGNFRLPDNQQPKVEKRKKVTLIFDANQSEELTFLGSLQRPVVLMKQIITA